MTYGYSDIINVINTMKNFVKPLFQNHSPQFLSLYTLHILNDGFHASFLLMLPFIAKDMQLNLTEVGILGTIVNSLGIFLALPAAYMATRVGGMKTLIIALFVYGLGYLATGLAPNYIWLFLTFSLVGIGFGVFHPIGFSLIAKWSQKETRGRQMGNFTAIGDVGRIGIAAILTFIIVYIGWQNTAILYAAIAIAIAVAFYFLFRSKREEFTTKEKSVQHIKLLDIITHKKFIFASTASFFDSFASSSLFIFLPFLLLMRGVEPALLGSFAAAFFIGNFVGKTSLGRFVDKYGNAKVFIASELLMAFFIILLANSTAFVIIIICSVILGMFTKGTTPVLQTMISEAADHHGNFEKTFGANSFVTSTASALAPVLLGIVSDKFGIIAAFNFMAVVALLAIIPAFAFQLTKKAK